jgi:hypothetical protein
MSPSVRLSQINQTNEQRDILKNAGGLDAEPHGGRRGRGQRDRLYFEPQAKDAASLR